MWDGRLNSAEQKFNVEISENSQAATRISGLLLTLMVLKLLLNEIEVGRGWWLKRSDEVRSIKKRQKTSTLEPTALF
jgi:hypothetical protein